jgi:predicted RNA-binding protein
MANMSYCMFENTYNDLSQCYGALREAIDEGTLKEFIEDMTREERAAYKHMYHLLEMMLSAYQEAEDTAADDEE